MASFCTSMHMVSNVSDDAHSLASFSCGLASMRAPQLSGLQLEHFVMEMAFIRDETLAFIFFDEF